MNNSETGGIKKIIVDTDKRVRKNNGGRNSNITHKPRRCHGGGQIRGQKQTNLCSFYCSITDRGYCGLYCWHYDLSLGHSQSKAASPRGGRIKAAVMYNGVFRTVFGIARDEGPK